VGSVACNGNKTVSPKAATTYTLTAMGAGGMTTATVSVTVSYCHDIVSFNPTSCPGSSGGGCATAFCPAPLPPGLGGAITGFCAPAPIVATSSSQAQLACNACLVASNCVNGNPAFGSSGGGAWGIFVYLTASRSVYCRNTSTYHRPAAGEIVDGDGCPLVPASRWAP
jgi:hypothetical protein